MMSATSMQTISPPLPTFASTIRSQDRSSLASNRRSGSQYSSDGIHGIQEDDSCKPTYSQLSDFEFLRSSRSTELPLYRSRTNGSSFEILRGKASPWTRRTRSSPDLERGIEMQPPKQTAHPHYVDGRPVFPSLIGVRNRGFRGSGIWRRWRARWRHWLGNQSRRRKIALVLEITLAGLIVGIIVGLSFGVIEDSVPRNNTDRYYTKPEYLGHGGAL